MSLPAGTSFWVGVPRQVADRATHHFSFLLEELDPLVRLAQLGRHVIRGGHRRRPAGTVLAVGDLEPAMQAGLRDPEVLRDLAQRRLTLAGHGNDIGSELGGKRFRHEVDPSSEDESSQVRSQPNWGQSPSATARGYPDWWQRLSETARAWQPFCTDCGSLDNLTLDHSPEAWRLIDQGKRLTLNHVAAGLLTVVCAVCNRKRGAARGQHLSRPYA